MINELIDRGASAIGNMLPERRFNVLREAYLYFCLSNIICEAKLLQDGSLFVELNNGLKFYAQKGRGSYPSAKYAHSRNFGKLKEFMKHVPSLPKVLFEQYIRDIYEKYYKVKRGDIVIDGGAHIGLFTVKAGQAVGDEGMVIAIEPEPDNLKFLKRNIEANELTNVVIIGEGVWSRKDRLKLSIKNSTDTHTFLGRKDAIGFIEVEVDTVDNILRGLGIMRIDFIKMDIEGAEIEALKGMKETLQNTDVKLAIAAYHEVEGKQTHKTIAPWLRRSGFQVYVKRGIVYGMKQRPL